MGAPHHPLTVELVVTVNIQALGEADQHPFALGLDSANLLGDELGFVGLQVLEGEENLCQGLAGDRSLDLVCGAPNFRTFWHGCTVGGSNPSLPGVPGGSKGRKKGGSAFVQSLNAN